MNRFSTPDEIFGPVSIKQLRDEDKYQRVVENYLPSATVVFLDEIWKAGPSIQNALLTILNEKIYRNGDVIIDPVPMKALISASNELPSKGEGLEALWDRFLVRIVVEGIQDKQNFNGMISKSLNSYSDKVTDFLKISNDEYILWSKEIDAIEIPTNVFNVIHIIRNYITLHNERDENLEKQIYISDRRWRKIIRLLRTSAFLNDRIAVDLMDCFLIKDCLWNETEQIQTVSQFVKEAIQKYGYTLSLKLSDIEIEINELNKDVIKETFFLKEVDTFQLYAHLNNYYKIIGFGDGNYAIKVDDYNELTSQTEDYIYLYLYYYNYAKKYERYNKCYIKKGEGFNIFINESEYTLETITSKTEIKTTKKAHHATQKYWDREISKYLTTTSNLKHQINHFRENDLKHLKVNLFVNSVFSEIVESNLNETAKSIEKLELEVNRIKDFYENIEDQTSQMILKELTK
jgi:MoxR-like ATPase